MENYKSKYTGEQIDEAVGKALDLEQVDTSKFLPIKEPTAYNSFSIKSEDTWTNEYGTSPNNQVCFHADGTIQLVNYNGKGQDCWYWFAEDEISDDNGGTIATREWVQANAGGGGKIYHHRVRATFTDMSWDVGLASAFNTQPPYVVEFDIFSTKSTAFERIEDALKEGESVNCSGYTGVDSSSGSDDYKLLTHCGMNVNGFWVACYMTYTSGMSAPERYDFYASSTADVTITDTVTEV